MEPGTPREIEGFLNEHSVDVLIIDQMRNLMIPKSEGQTQILDNAAKLCRKWARKYNILVVGVTQAGESARNKVCLEQEDVEYSNTGVAAAADVMIGVGYNEDMYNRGLRTLSICKNKRTSGHPNCSVKFNDQTSNMVSL